MVCMANTLLKPIDGFDNADEERVNSTLEPDNFNQTLLAGGFELLLFKAGLTGQSGDIVMFLGDPDGEIVKDAQVITTIIGQSDAQQMRRARPRKGGYVIDINYLKLGQYRLEIEIVAAGWLLTDEFYFHKV